MENPLGKSVGTDELRKSGSAPVVLVFQPDSFTVAETPEQLKEWERLATASFDVPSRVAGRFSELAQNGGTCCESGDTNDCDVD